MEPAVAWAPQHGLARRLKEKICHHLRDCYQLHILQRSLLTDDQLPSHTRSGIGFAGAGSGP